MTPVYQSISHDPRNGFFGDCHRACLASILDLPLEAVPHIGDGLWSTDQDSIEFERREREFLLSQGLVTVKMGFMPEDSSLEAVLRCQALLNPDTYYILGGQSKNGTNHSVIAHNDRIVHDPLGPEGSGVVKPLIDGYYLLTFLGCARFQRSLDQDAKT